MSEALLSLLKTGRMKVKGPAVGEDFLGVPFLGGR